MSKDKMKRIMEEADKIENPLGKIGYMQSEMRKIAEPKLEAAIKKAEKKARKKAFWEKVGRFFFGGVYEHSQTFYEPARVAAEVSPGTEIFSLQKGKGIERPFAKKLITPRTKKLYHHESGIVGLVEKDSQGLHRVVRLPFVIAGYFGLKRLSQRYPRIQKGLDFEPQMDMEGVTAYSDGDVVYTKTVGMMELAKKMKDNKAAELTRKVASLMPEDIAKQILAATDPFALLVLNDEQSLKHAMRHLYALHGAESQRSAAELTDYGEACDLERESERFAGTPISMVCGHPNKFLVLLHLQSGAFLGRIYANSRGQNSEIRVPFEAAQAIKREGRSTNVKPLDDFLQNQSLSLTETRTEQTVKHCDVELPVTHSIKFDGDLVYNRVVYGSMQKETAELREEVDNLGSRYLEAMKNIGFMM